MRPTLLLICLLLTTLTACRQGSIPIPEEVIAPDVMTAILTDLQLAESTLSVAIYDSLDIYRAFYFALVFEKHGVSQETFDSSFRFYQQHPALLGEVLDQVLIKLSMIQSERPWGSEVLKDDSIPAEDPLENPLE